LHLSSEKAGFKMRLSKCNLHRYVEQKEADAAMFEGTSEEQAAAVQLQAMQLGRMVGGCTRCMQFEP
jgi:hypothetical protein